MIGPVFLRTIDESLRSGYASGALEVTGSTVVNSATRRVVAHLQPTKLFDAFLGTAAQGALNTLSQGFSPLGAISVIQNQVILGKLRQMSAALELLQSLSVASLAVSGLGLGVSVAGFAALHQRLKGIDQHLDVLAQEVTQVTFDRRRDDMKRDLADMRTELDAVDALDRRSEKAASGVAAQQRLATLAGRLELHMLNHLEQAQQSVVKDADLDLIWSLAAAIRLCHDTGLRALFAIDDLGGAAGLTARQAGRFVDLIGQLPPPDALAWMAAKGVTDRDAAMQIRARVLPLARQLAGGLHASASGIMSQSMLSEHLLAQGIHGPDYMRETQSEASEPMLFLPLPNAR